MSFQACCVDVAAAIPGRLSAETGPFLSLIHFLDAPPPGNTTTASAVTNSVIEDAKLLYNFKGWGSPFFSVNRLGNISVRPYGTETLAHEEIDLFKIVKKVSDQKSTGGLGFRLPLIVRFSDILNDRLVSLQDAFDRAVRSNGYSSHYEGVFPIKCNQNRFVVEDIVKLGKSSRFGLEAGSKPELLLAMSCMCKENSESLLICNGFKDAVYISLALIAKKLKLNAIIVIQEEEELDLVMKLSNELSIKPVIGLRAKLKSKHSGQFGSIAGEKSKFGLNITQILRVIGKLKLAGMLECLQLLHFHMGSQSQIPTTAMVECGVIEATQIYCELVRLGANMSIIDIGGGTGIDFESVEYGLEDYALTVVKSVQQICNSKNVKHPVICCESGPTIVSHHSVLVFEATSGTVIKPPVISPVELHNFIESLSEEGRIVYQNLCDAAIYCDVKHCSIYADQLEQSCVEQFKTGNLSIENLAIVEGLCESEVLDPVINYTANLSIFTSVPDFRTGKQLFPIVPIHGLDLRPTVKGILSDLTCDSDGGETSLPLHDTGGGGGVKYYLGMFGAYEEAFGGLPNLFGIPSSVQVKQSNNLDGFIISNLVSGQSSAEVLRLMQHDPDLMLETIMRRAIDIEDADAVKKGLVSSFNNMPYLASSSSS